MTRELWEVTLEVDGRRETTVVTIEPPFGIRQADAEVKAIRSAEREGASEVRALRSRFIREETLRIAQTFRMPFTVEQLPPRTRKAGAR